MHLSNYEWQPARLYPAHGKPQNRSAEDLRKIFRIRPISIMEVNPFVIVMHQKLGCDAEQWFAIHEEDTNGEYACCCEREVLTD
jgi:hypothetical protein